MASPTKAPEIQSMADLERRYDGSIPEALIELARGRDPRIDRAMGIVAFHERMFADAERALASWIVARDLGDGCEHLSLEDWDRIIADRAESVGASRSHLEAAREALARMRAVEG